MRLAREIARFRHFAAALAPAIGCAAALGMALAPNAAAAQPRAVDARRLAAGGVRVLDGAFVRVLTDLPPSPAVDELPAVFDAAVPQWAKYFQTPDDKLRGARWSACVVQDRARFAALQLLPTDNPNFINGYARDGELWLAEQPSDYYRRHLLLHEGTHAFMQTMLGGCGSAWYMEGVAELLGTHQWRDGKLQLGAFPGDRDDFPMWGRIKAVRDAADQGAAWPLARVLAVDNRRELGVDSYAWTWALAALLDGDPKYQARFRALQANVRDPQFTATFRQAFAADWDELAVAWEAYAAALDYGYDVPRMSLEPRRAAPLADRAQATIPVDRGWQSTGWLLRAGRTYRLTAEGRYQIARDPDGAPWPCEPGGVTLKYHAGKPLGALVAALVPTDSGNKPRSEPPAPIATFARPMLLGLAATITPSADSVLYVRANDSPAQLADNAGAATITGHDFTRNYAK